MLRQEDIREDIGRVTGGTFIRITHVPTGISRTKGPLAGESANAIRKRFLKEIEEELIFKDLSCLIVPAYRTRYGEL